jgi:hypothetical protein
MHKDRLLEPAQTINLLTTIAIRVLEELQEAIIRQHYNNPVHRHLGIT